MGTMMKMTEIKGNGKRRVLMKRTLTRMLSRTRRILKKWRSMLTRTMMRTTMMKMIQSLKREASGSENRQKHLRGSQVREAAKEEVEFRPRTMNLTMGTRKEERRRNQGFKQRRRKRRSQSRTLEAMTTLEAV